MKDVIFATGREWPRLLYFVNYHLMLFATHPAGGWTAVVLPDLQNYTAYGANFGYLRRVMEWIVSGEAPAGWALRQGGG